MSNLRAKHAAAALSIILAIALVIVSYKAIRIAGDRLDCRHASGGGGFCALRAEGGGGLSVQYVQGLTVWAWDAEGDNRLLWPVE